MMPQRPSAQPSPRPMPGPTGRTPTGQPIMTMEDQERLRQWQLEQQAQAPQQEVAPPPFPGTEPQMESPGLLARTMDYLQQGFEKAQNTLGGQFRDGVAPENNPLADPQGAPGVGVGGRARADEIERKLREAEGRRK